MGASRSDRRSELLAALGYPQVPGACDSDRGSATVPSVGVPEGPHTLTRRTSFFFLTASISPFVGAAMPPSSVPNLPIYLHSSATWYPSFRILSTSPFEVLGKIQTKNPAKLVAYAKALVSRMSEVLSPQILDGTVGAHELLGNHNLLTSFSRGYVELLLAGTGRSIERRPEVRDVVEGWFRYRAGRVTFSVDGAGLGGTADDENLSGTSSELLALDEEEVLDCLVAQLGLPTAETTETWNTFFVERVYGEASHHKRVLSEAIKKLLRSGVSAPDAVRGVFDLWKDRYAQLVAEYFTKYPQALSQFLRERAELLNEAQRLQQEARRGTEQRKYEVANYPPVLTWGNLGFHPELRSYRSGLHPRN